MSYKKKFLLLLSILSQVSFSGVGRYDIPWIDYEDFAMNSGKYKIGKKGINVYKVDQDLSGKIEQPIPNFDGVVNWGNFTLYSDPQLLGSVTHVGNQKNYDFLTRHLRKDVNLFKNYKSNPNAQFDNFSEKGNTPYYFTTGRDYSLGRLDKIIFDGITYETIDSWDKIKAGDLVARIGGGVNTAIQKDNTARGTAPYGNLAGGLNKLNAVVKDPSDTNDVEEYRVTLSIESTPKTAIDIGTNGGDSGSPLFWWDKTDNKWKIISNNSRGSNAGRWGKFSVLVSNIDVLNKIKKGISDEEITENSVSFNNGNLIVGSKSKSFIDERIQGDSKTTVNHYIKHSNSDIPDDLFKIKNQIFNKNGITIDLVGNTDTSVARLEFKDNAIIQGSGSLKTAGFVIDKDKTLKYKANIGDKNVVRVIGEGTLLIEGTSKNEGEINIGQGNLILKNNGGYAAKKIRIAQGATVKLGDANQLNGNNVYFGLRGGNLDLNGNNETFSDIYHIDSGATITNTNVSKATFEFNPSDSEERVFLGKFSGKLDVKYNPNLDISKWDLRGNTDITGNLDIEKGNVSISGDNVVHGYRKEVGKDEFERVIFKSENINVNNNSNLTINRASEVNSKISVGDRASLNLNYLGNVNKERDNEKPYEGALTEKEINDVVLKGEINLTQGSKFKVNSENDNEITIESKITGTIDLEKEGTGLLNIKNNENSMSGRIHIKNGKIKVLNENNLGTSKTNIDDIAVLEVENPTNFSNILNKIDTRSSGILSLGNNIPGLDVSYKNYSNLFLGSSKNITIGGANTPIPVGISTLNLGGDNGTVTLKGLDLSTGVTTLNIGNGKHDGTVIIDKIGDQNTNLTINTNRVKLEIKNNTTSNKILNLGYGATVGYKNKNIVKEDSANGVLLLGRDDTSNIENIGNSYVGADKSNKRPITLTDVNTGDKYRFSGDGNLSLNMELENKEVIVDGQYLSGGVVEIAKDNPNYQGNITIMGNKNGTNEGNITLKYKADYGTKFTTIPNPNFDNSKPANPKDNPSEIIVPELIKNNLGGDNKNTYLIKDGGILETGGRFDTTLNMKFDSANNEYGIIKNTSRAATILHIYADEDTKVNNLLEGNFKLYKKGANKLEFTNENNKLKNGKFDKVDLVVEEGTLVYKKPDALNNVKMTLNNDNTTLEAHASNVKADIISNGGKIKLFDNGSNEKYIDYLEVTKDSNVNWDNDTKSNKRVVYKTLKVASEKLTIENQFFEIGNMINKTAESELVLKNSSLRLQGRDNDKLIKNKIDKLTLDNSNLILRDFRRAEKEEKSNDADTDVVYEPTNIEVIGNSSIQNGSVELNDNGGGAMTIINNPITMSDKNVVLSLKSDGGFPGQGLIVDSNISGNGKIELYTKNVVNAWNKTRLTIRNNFKDFTGTLESKINDNEMRFDIRSDDEENRTLNYKIIGSGQFVNHSKNSLIFKNIESFTGIIKAERGDIVLSGNNAINTSATIKLENDKNIILRANEDTNAINTNLKVELKDTSKLIKDGNAKLELGDNLKSTNVKNVEVKEGELSLTKDILTTSDTSKYNVLENATLTLNTRDTLWTSNIEGSGNIKQAGDKVKINNTVIKNTGDVLITSELELVRTLANEEISANLKGEETSKLTLVKGNNDNDNDNNFVINKEIPNFKGEFNLDSSNLHLNVENMNLNNKVSGSFDLVNKNNSALTLNDLRDFNGKAIAKNGDIVLKGINAINDNSKFELENNNNLIFDLSNDKHINSLNINVSGDNLTSSIIKRGDGTLTLGSGIVTSNLRFANIETGILKLEKNILKGNDSKYTVNLGAKLILDIANGVNWETKFEGKGTIIQNGSNGKLNLNEDKTGGNIELNKDLTLVQGIDKISISSDIIGLENVTLKLDKLDSLNSEAEFELKGDLNKFKGKYNLSTSNLSINKDNFELENEILGNASIINNNNSDLTLSNLKSFNGYAIARKGNIVLKGINAINSNVKVKLENNKDLVLETVEDIEINKNLNISKDNENSGSKLIKRGNNKLSFSNLVSKTNLDNILIEEGELELSKDILKDGENSKYTVNENTILTLKTNIWNKNIEGRGDIKQGINNLTIYNSNINNMGNFEITSTLSLLRTMPKEKIKANFKGNENTKLILDKEANINDNSYYLIDKNISDYRGELKLNTTDLGLNLDDFTLENRITGNNSLINLNNTNLSLKNLKEFEGSVVARNGNVLLDGENAINTNINILLENNKNLILKSNKDIDVIENLSITSLENESKIIKEGNSKIKLGENVKTLNTKNLEVKEGKLEIVKNILNEDATIDIKENSELILNYLSKDTLNSKLMGNGNIVQNGKELIVSNIEDFSGNLISNKAITLDIDKNINLNKLVLNDEYVRFKNSSNNDLDISSLNIESINDARIKKSGISNIKISSEQLKSIKNLDVEEGSLSISNENFDNKINTNINVAENTNLKLLDNLYVDNIGNKGDIILNNTNLRLSNYRGSENSKFDVTLGEFNKLLILDNTSGIVNVKLNLVDSLISKIKNENKELHFASLKDNLNILNFDKYDKIYGLMKRKDGKKVIIYSYVRAKNSNLIYILNNLNELVEINNNSKFKNSITANYINSYKKDNISNKLNDVSYINKLETNGLEIQAEYAGKIEDVNLSSAITYIKTNNVIKTDVELENGNNVYIRKFNSNIFMPRFAFKYKNVGAELEIGYNHVDILDEDKSYIRLLKNRLSIFLNPEINIDKDTKLIFNNNVSYINNMIISENISKKDENISKITLDNSHILSFETGIRAESKYVNLGLKANMIFNYSKLSISNSDEIVNNLYNIKRKLNLKYLVDIKPTKNISFNFEGNLNILNSKYNQSLFKLGMSYTW